MDAAPPRRQRRRDAHRPQALVTEDYEFVYCGVHAPPEGMHVDRRYSQALVATLVEEGWRFDDVHGAHQCSHCGKHLNYYAVVKHMPSRTLIHVGEECLDNRFERASSDFHRLRAQAALSRQMQRIKRAREEWQAAHPDEYDFLEQAYEHGHNEFHSSLWRRLLRDGVLTDRQLEALQESMQREAGREAARAEEQQMPAAPVIEGRIEMEGRVLGVKSQESRWGSTLKMLVRDDRGFKVWSTVPDGLLDGDGPLRGARIRFTATVTPSAEDETFGFCKRPTRASRVEAA